MFQLNGNPISIDSEQVIGGTRYPHLRDPALREQLFLAEGLSTEQLEARILEGTERLDFERAQDTYNVSQVGNSDAASADNKYCPYCLKHKNKRLIHKESNCYAKHPEKRPKHWESW
jgi:hypothetical protein